MVNVLSCLILFSLGEKKQNKQTPPSPPPPPNHKKPQKTYIYFKKYLAQRKPVAYAVVCLTQRLLFVKETWSHISRWAQHWMFGKRRFLDWEQIEIGLNKRSTHPGSIAMLQLGLPVSLLYSFVTNLLLTPTSLNEQLVNILYLYNSYLLLIFLIFSRTLESDKPR